MEDVETTSTSMAILLETIVTEKRELGHSEGSPFPAMGKSPPFVENERVLEDNDDLIVKTAELLSPFGSILVLTL